MTSLYIICKTDDDRNEFADSSYHVYYEIHTVFPGETYFETTDQISGEQVTIFKRGKDTVNSAGKFCGEYTDIKEARINMSRLQKIYEVMES